MAKRNNSFSDRAKTIMGKYKTRLGENLDGEDLPAREAMNRELEELRAEQEMARSELFGQFSNEFEMACGGKLMKKEMGGNLPEAKFGTWLKENIFPYFFSQPMNWGKTYSDQQKANQLEENAKKGLPIIDLNEYEYNPVELNQADYDKLKQIDYSQLAPEDLAFIQSQGVDISKISLADLATIDPSLLQTIDLSNIDTKADVERVSPELLNLEAQREDSRRRGTLNRSIVNRAARNLGPQNRVSSTVAGLTQVDRNTGNEINQSYLNEQLTNTGAINQARQFNASNQNRANLADTNLRANLQQTQALNNADILNSALYNNVNTLNREQLANADTLNNALYYNTNLANEDRRYNTDARNKLAYYNNSLTNQEINQNANLYNNAYLNNVDIQNKQNLYNSGMDLQVQQLNNSVLGQEYDSLLRDTLYRRGQADAALANRVQWGADTTNTTKQILNTILPLILGDFSAITKLLGENNDTGSTMNGFQYDDPYLQGGYYD